MTKKCHFIGIGGIGMSGLARILLSKNIQVSGSDIANNYLLEGLSSAGAEVHVGHSSKHITKDMTVIYSSGIQKDNPEYQQALNLQCPLLHRSDLLLQIMTDYKTLAIAGTHGKTTTSALLTEVLKGCGLDPAFALGGILANSKANGGVGQGEYFVAEADESDGTFLKYSPYAAIVTNIENEHMDFYKTREALDTSFSTFIDKVEKKDLFFWCKDDPRLSQLNPLGISYGFDSSASLKLSKFKQLGWSISYDIEFNGRYFPQVEVNLTGIHNALNSAAVFGLALALGGSESHIRTALKAFKGVARRCERKKVKSDVYIVDDYAHHPTEIKATLEAIRHAIKERRLIAIFQPHRYSRMKDCLNSFGEVFSEADILFVTDIYGAGEVPIEHLDSFKIIDTIKSNSKVPCHYVPKNNLLNTIKASLMPHDVIVTLGAGDITYFAKELADYLDKNPVPKLKVGVIFGGRSCEHEVSLSSSQYILDSLDKSYYDVVRFGISKSGQWHSDPSDNNLLQTASPSKHHQTISPEAFKNLCSCDLFFPVLHGRFGEDGCLQGFFDILDKPYVGCDHRSSALCMDKAMTKKLMLVNGIAVVPFIDFGINEWLARHHAILQQIQAQLVYPMFVKPVHLGSTLGVKKVSDQEELKHAIKEAFLIDDHVIIENGLKVREIEFAVFGNRWVTVLPPGEVITGGKVHDYDSKYGAASSPMMPIAELTRDQIEEGCFLAEAAYKAVGCSGLARIDFFFDEAGKYWLNEVNPIPGFTSSSLYPRMCEANGIAGKELVENLIVLALHRNRQLQRIC